MDPYRSPSKQEEYFVIGPRWGVSLWKKWYVRIARVVFDLREKYAEQREYNQYLRDSIRWDLEYGELKKNREALKLSNGYIYYRGYPAIPPRPCPPPVRIME